MVRRNTARPNQPGSLCLAPNLWMSPVKRPGNATTRWFLAPLLVLRAPATTTRAEPPGLKGSGGSERLSLEGAPN
jgi:hypothetical protein